MTLIDTRLKNQANNTESHDCDAFGKLVWSMYPECSNQIGQYLKNATHLMIMTYEVLRKREYKSMI